MEARKNKIRYGIGIALTIILTIDLLPYLWLLVSSFRASDDPFTSSVLPSRYTIGNYVTIFQNEGMMRPFFNSLVVAVGATVITMVLSLLAAYGFSRYYFKGKDFLLGFLVNLRTFPALLLAIALYVMAVKTGLYNTYVPLILANTMMNLPFAIWNVKTVIDGIPKDLEESALVDGLSRTSVIWKIIVPVATPGLAATAIYVFILTWNEYLFATTFMNSNDMQLVTSVIASAVTQFGVDYGWLMTTAMLASIPAIIMFIAIQRFIVGGLTAGGVKG
ncbi:MAG: carbohydrate ABC transporter permease [Dorea sp.]|jgi:multiple sugar transport system permease protein|nr:carbohydrate ABC transporter permease [Dorea sp.]MCI9248334.1 carbohydrate ABC transporter permease [Dorea sp.]